MSGCIKGQETIHIYGEILEYEKGKLLSYTDHPGLCTEKIMENYNQESGYFEPMGQST